MQPRPRYENDDFPKKNKKNYKLLRFLKLFFVTILTSVQRKFILSDFWFGFFEA